MKTLIATSLLALLIAAPAQANKAFVSNERSNTITVVDTDTWEVLQEFDGGNRPRGITLSPDGSKLYVCASDDNLVRVFDTETYRELDSLPSGPDPELFILEPSGKRLYIANEDDNMVTELHHTSCFFHDHFGNLDMAGCFLVKRTCNNFY